MAGIVAGGLVVVVLMITHGPLANEPIMYGIPASFAGYVVVSLLTPRTEAAVLEAWRRRLAGAGAEPDEAVAM